MPRAGWTSAAIYLRHGNYLAAINRFQVVVTDYQTTAQVEEALSRLTEAYMALGIIPEAQTAAACSATTSRTVEWYKNAYALLQNRAARPAAARGLVAQQDLEERRQPRRTRAMLAALSIRDIVLIDALDLEFEGACALTGETGAGKSILLDAFALALGGRGDAGLVRRGARHGQVTAIFDPAAEHPVLRLLAENDMEARRLVLRRVQSADGRTRAFVNDVAGGRAARCAELGQLLVEIHGQHDDRAPHRARPPTAPCSTPMAASSWRRCGASAAALERLTRTETAGRRAAGDDRRHPRPTPTIWSHALGELARLRSPGRARRKQLAARRQRMMQLGEGRQGPARRSDALAGRSGTAASLESRARRLERQRGRHRGADRAGAAAIERLLVEADEARATVEEALAAAAFEPGELERGRGAPVRAARRSARKHRVAGRRLPVALLRDSIAELAAARRRRGPARRVAARGGQVAPQCRWSSPRRASARPAAPPPAGWMPRSTASLPPLKLGQGPLHRVEIASREEWAADGMDRVTFQVRTNPGPSAGPLDEGRLGRRAVARSCWR